MFETFSASIGIVKKSFGILAGEKKLLIFPAISSIALIALLVSFIVPMAFFDSDISLAFAALFYLLSYFVVIFFNSALVHAAASKMDGKPVSVGGSISFAFSRLVPIMAWAAVASTVGLLLSALRGQASRQRGVVGILSGIVVGLIGMAWSLATFFVIPIMVLEGAGPLDALKRSVGLIKKTWGEAVVGGFGISMVFFVLYIAVAALAVLSLAVFPSAILLLLAVACFAALFLVQNTLQGIFVSAVYRYATTGNAALFSNEELAGAFKHG